MRPKLVVTCLTKRITSVFFPVTLSLFPDHCRVQVVDHRSAGSSFFQHLAVLPFRQHHHGFDMEVRLFLGIVDANQHLVFLQLELCFLR